MILRHVIKNALMSGGDAGGFCSIPIIVVGAVIMEQMFAIPGLGRLMIDALFDRDYPLISGINLFFAAAVMVINLLVDVLYAYLDPRVHYGIRGGGNASLREAEDDAIGARGRPRVADAAAPRVAEHHGADHHHLLDHDRLGDHRRGVSLSFLGFGLPPDVPSWGTMLSREGRQYMEMAPRLAMWPGVALTLVVYCLNMVGDALRDLLDPRLRGGGGSLGGGVGARAAERARKALQKLERSR